MTTYASFDYYEKWIELLNELLPKLSSIFSLHRSRTGNSRMAKRAGTSLIPILLGSTINEAAYESAFKSMDQDRADALLVSNENEHFAYRAALVKLVAERRLPAMYPYREIVESGGLMSYAVDLVELFRSLAVPVADILKGKKPQDIPISQPTKFELVINLKTAKSQGIDVPPTLLARADEVIE